MGFQSIQTTLVLSGLGNGSPSNTQQPTVTFDNLPFGLWGSLPEPRTVTGTAVGVFQPDQFQIMVLPVDIDDQGRRTVWGSAFWVAAVAADGTFSVPVSGTAQLYSAFLATPSFMQSWTDSQLAGGTKEVSSVPTPSSNPGDVALSLTVPAGVNRLIQLSETGMPPLAPGQGWSGTNAGTQRSLQPPSSNDPARNPTQSQYASQVWQQMLGGAPWALSMVVNSYRPDGSRGKGAFAAGVYVYGSSMYLVAGAGSTDGSSTPIIAASQIVDWNAFVPDSVKVGMTITVLPENVVFAADVLNVEASSLQQFLIAYEKVMFKMLGLLMDMV